MIKLTSPFSAKPIFLSPPFDAVYEGYAASPWEPGADIDYTKATIIYINGNEFGVKESVEEVIYWITMDKSLCDAKD